MARRTEYIKDYPAVLWMQVHAKKTAEGLVPAIESWWTAGYYGEKKSRLVWVRPTVNGAVWGAPDGTHYDQIKNFPDWLARVAPPDLEVRDYS